MQVKFCAVCYSANGQGTNCGKVFCSCLVLAKEFANHSIEKLFITFCLSTIYEWSVHICIKCIIIWESLPLNFAEYSGILWEIWNFQEFWVSTVVGWRFWVLQKQLFPSSSGCIWILILIDIRKERKFKLLEHMKIW